MKNKILLTTVLLLSCIITGLYAAAPGGASGAEAGSSAAAAYEPSEEAVRNLEDMWLLDSQSQLQDAIAQQLAKDLSRAAGGARSVEGIARPYGGVGGMFSRAMLEKTRDKLLRLEPSTNVYLTHAITYRGDYGSFKATLIDRLNSELTRIGANHGVRLGLHAKNLGQLVRDNPDQFIDLINAINDTITNNSHQCVLTRLYLHDNGLETLPERVFDSLGSLGSLDLGDNRLTTLPPDIFAGLNNMYWLSLEGNQLTTLTPGTFAGLSNLEELNLSRNQLATLPPGIFAGLKNLRGLDLFGNQLPPDAATQAAIRRELPATTEILF